MWETLEARLEYILMMSYLHSTFERTSGEWME